MGGMRQNRKTSMKKVRNLTGLEARMRGEGEEDDLDWEGSVDV